MRLRRRDPLPAQFRSGSRRRAGGGDGLRRHRPGVLRNEGVGFFAPDLLAFYGRDAEGRRTRLVQDVTQLDLLLRAMPKEPDRVEPRRIGFRLAAALEDASGGS